MNRAMKASIKYRLRDYRQILLTLYLCIYLLFLFSICLKSFNVNNNVSFGSMEPITAVTVFVVGLTSFKEYFKFFSVNGISRKTMFFSTTSSLAVLSAAFSLIDTINCVIFSKVTSYYPIFTLLYRERYHIDSISKNVIFTPQILLEHFIWFAFLYFFLSLMGLFITTAYYRMNKALKIIVSVAVPLLLINGMNFVDVMIGGSISNFISSAMLTMFGLSNGSNPYIGMLSMFLLTAIFAAFSFLLARKADVKK